MTRKTKILFGRFVNSMNIFNLPKTLEAFREFDEITTFRLVNSFIVAFGITMLIPVLTVLQGTLMLAWVIALFKIGDMLAVKSNEIFVHSFSMDKLYKMTVILHLLYTLSASLYFWNPLVMIYTDSILALLEAAIISAYSITLNNYIADNYPKSMSRFQIVRNSSWADGALIGLLISTTTLYLFPLGWTLGIFLFINSIFTIWLLKNWDFYKGRVYD
jgi:MFS family permease